MQFQFCRMAAIPKSRRIVVVGRTNMKKLVVAAFLLLMTGSAFAERPCRAWHYHHHHRYCSRW
jgi:hypothetical protein